LTAKEYLSEITRIDRRIDRRLTLRQEYWDKATKATSCPSFTPKAKGNHSPIEYFVAKIIDLEKEIDREVDALVDRRRAAQRVIESIPDHRYRDILELRYLHGAKWEIVMEDMHYERSRIYELHGLALKAFQKKADETGLLTVV